MFIFTLCCLHVSIVTHYWSAAVCLPHHWHHRRSPLLLLQLLLCHSEWRSWQKWLNCCCKTTDTHIIPANMCFCCTLTVVLFAQDTSVLSPSPQIALILSLAFIIFKKSTSLLFERHCCLYVLTFGMAISKISCKLVVSPCFQNTHGLQCEEFTSMQSHFKNVIDTLTVSP